ncbi:response regulator transcription factor [Paenibacillus sp. S150]|uniref:response regulator transcription factor n=1 Tax=Paenibacillus sp. S150 TaxID=2749826 RepID=UPI001C57513D|nr:response regulator transcription factor [Paenibacillus sp. S150]MBW4081985.1 response regulator transcription factor [Paenibacillus sp. S150]
MRVLMIEDEKYMAEAIAQVLRKHHYSVDLAYDGENGLDFAVTGIYDLIILDIMLPKLDGIQVLRRLRDEGIAIPVILLTARDAPEDKVRGLDTGADDYLAKPFHTGELLARIRALGRRTPEWLRDGVLSCADLELNPQTLICSCNGEEIQLPLKEAQVLELLMKSSPRIVSKEHMIDKLWGYDTEAEGNRVEIHISLLRKKLNRLQTKVSIETVRHAGYVLRQRRDETGNV